ncbi:MAG: glutathione S-transferase [Glaciecola sp.]|jgi:glutathione S-transferase
MEYQNMITLYGFPASNYYGLIKHAILIKGIDFNEERTYPGHLSYLEKSPMGKVPCIGTEHGFLSETTAILDYFECNYPDKPILPSDAFQRAKSFELMRIAELYVELSGRRFLPEILMGVPKSESNRALMLPILIKAFASLEKMAAFSPYLMGETCTQADLVVRYSLKTGVMVGEKIFEVDFMEKAPKLQGWWNTMSNDPISKIVDAQAEESFPEFIGILQKAFVK